MDALIAFWGHALAAAMFAALLIWRVLEPARRPGQRLLLAAFAVTACWSWLWAIEPGSGLARYAETARNLVWLGLLYSLSAASDERQRGVRWVYGAVAAVLGCQLFATYLRLTSPSDAVVQTADLLRLTTAAGALVLVHNLYGQAAPSTRSHIRYAMLGLAVMWVYDLNYYTVLYLKAESAEWLADWRGLAMALAAPLFALSVRGERNWNIRLSRAASFQSISLLAICGYFALMAIVATALRGSEVDWVAGLTVAMLAAMTIALMVVLPSPKARAWLKVKLAKHLFEHRYDYRAEWLRFADTLGRVGIDAPPLGQRVIRAFADIVDAPGGALIVRDGSSALQLAAELDWAAPPPGQPALIALAPMWKALEGSGRAIEFDALRGGWAGAPERAIPVPAWILEDERIWAAVPLAHHERLVGLVLLIAPGFRRPLDWEDFDLLRTAGCQAASALAEAQGQEALAHAQRFEEFNRRFAFILHDIKNLVSQLSLVARNAERHADNPEFRADMVATLQGSVGKMNDLLARLAPAAQTRVHPPEPQSLRAPLEAVAGERPVLLEGALDSRVLADRTALEQALGHLVQNGCDASPPGAMVRIVVKDLGDRVTIAVMDAGCGMDAEFIRARLFEPFASTKADGFGIGAFEARSLIQAMGGRLDVSSRPGAGSTFTITLPAASVAAELERKRA